MSDSREWANQLAEADEDAYVSAAGSAQEGASYEAPTYRTNGELEALKVGWLKDPCWDIENTEGFEAYHDQLKAFSDEQYARWNHDQEISEKAREEALREADPAYWLKEITFELRTLNANLEAIAGIMARSAGRY